MAHILGGYRKKVVAGRVKSPSRLRQHSPRRGDVDGTSQPRRGRRRAAAMHGCHGRSKLPAKGSASSANKISLGKYENSVCHVASTVAVKI
eukprot:COSAG01_NODE_14924_length_1395_cov_1.425926_1_plen_90_part_10